MAKWLDDAVFYEIYPQSFMDTNADGIGDFQGIIRKLDYIKQLGCNAVWMNPCFASPFGDAGYDVSDYYMAAPRYGTNEDLKQIFEKVHELDMHIFLDLVPGHTSIQHKWFRESMKAERNGYTDRYVWTDDIWESVPGMGCLRGISDRNGSCGVNFFSNQPALNYGFYQPDPAKKWQQSLEDDGPKATLEALMDVMRFWLKMGCDGFRVDMASSLVKNDPEKRGTMRVWQKVREFMDREFPDAALVSEWGEPDRAIAGGFHMDFLLQGGPTHYDDLFRTKEPYFSSRGKGDISAFVKKYQENYKKIGQKGFMCLFSGNHDLDRLARYLHGDELKIAFAFILSMPGVPFIYYGDEIGMHYVEGLVSVEGGYNRTGSRSPMQWDDTLNGGFSSASAEKLYIPMDSSPDRPTVKGQMQDEDSLYHEVKRLIELRRNHKALHNSAGIEFVYAEENSYPLAYMRSYKNGEDQERIFVILNPSDKKQAFSCEYSLDNEIYHINGTAKRQDGRIVVDKRTAVMYVIK